MVFMDTAATIPTGSMAERLKFSGFVLMGLWVSMFIYPIIGGWVWGGGWLANLGRTPGWATARWTSPVPASCTWSAARWPWSAPS